MDAHSLECLDFYRIRELLAEYAMTALGRSLAMRAKPVTRADLVRRWFAQVAELGGFVEQHGLPPLAGITDVREIVKRCAPPLRVDVAQVAQVGDTLCATAAVGEYLAACGDSAPELKHLATRIGDFSTVADRIRAVIDERGEIRDAASPKIARIRREIARARSQIEQTVHRLLHDPKVRRLLQFTNHTYVNDRLVLPLRTECRGRLPGIVHRSSDSGATLFVEPAQAVELNNQISNLRSEENEEIARLLWDLTHEIYINTDAILKTLDSLSVLDLIVAKIRFAKQFQMRCPEICDEPTLNVRAARHPLLLELNRRRERDGQPPETVIPISYRIGADFDLLMITGPNTGGKTVTIKTVGLLSLMVQAGIPVPVEAGTRFGIFKRLLIDIGDEQSMQQSLSTFSAHLTRQLDMLKKAGANALILIDELGAGTDPDEGAAIGRAILDELLRLKSRCIASTHIGALKGYALQRERAENACVEFDLESLRPTYRLRIGEPGASNAIAIAQRLGMPKRLVHAAQRNVSKKSKALHTALSGTLDAKRKAEAARDAAETARLEADRAESDARSAKQKLEDQQAEFQTWLQRVVHLQPGDAVRVRNFDRDGKVVRVRLDQQRAEVDVGAFCVEVPLADVLPPQTPPPPPRPQAPPAAPVRAPKPRPRAVTRARPAPKDARHKRGAERAAPRSVQSLSDQEARALQPGDTVYVKRFHRRGTVMRVLTARNAVLVSAGLLEVEVAFDGLGRDAQPPPRRTGRPRPAPSAPTPPKPASPPAEDTQSTPESVDPTPLPTITPPPVAGQSEKLS